MDASNPVPIESSLRSTLNVNVFPAYESTAMSTPAPPAKFTVSVDPIGPLLALSTNNTHPTFSATAAEAKAVICP